MDKNINSNGFDYVDLGLPSGTLWATCNVGASKPSDYGLFFQWGDVKGYSKGQIGGGRGKKLFDYSNYKWNPSADGKTFTKYNTTGATLDLEDDAAHFYMGGDWHIPSPTQIKELVDNTTSVFATLNSVRGMKFTSKKDASKSLFIPAAGNVWGGFVENIGLSGNIWSSMLSTDHVYYCQFLKFNSGVVCLNNYDRFYGFPVRGVIG